MDSTTDSHNLQGVLFKMAKIIEVLARERTPEIGAPLVNLVDSLHEQILSGSMGSNDSGVLISALTRHSKFYGLPVEQLQFSTIDQYISHVFKARGKYFSTLFPLLSNGMRKDHDFHKYMTRFTEIPDTGTSSQFEKLIMDWGIHSTYRIENGLLGYKLLQDAILQLTIDDSTIFNFLTTYKYLTPTKAILDNYYNNFEVDVRLVDPVVYNTPRYDTKDHISLFFKRRGHMMYLNYDLESETYSYNMLNIPGLKYLSDDFYEKGMYIILDKNFALMYLEFYDGIVYDNELGINKIDHTAVMRVFSNIETLIGLHAHLFVTHVHMGDNAISSFANMVYKHNKNHCLNPLLLPVSVNVADTLQRAQTRFTYGNAAMISSVGYANNVTQSGFNILFSDDFWGNENILNFAHYPTIATRMNNADVPLLNTLELWWDVIYNSVSKFVDVYYTDTTLVEDQGVVNWITYLNWRGFEKANMNSLKNIVSILHFCNVLHECYANDTVRYDYVKNKIVEKVRKDGQPQSVYDTIIMGQNWITGVGETFKFSDKSLSHLVTPEGDGDTENARLTLDEFYDNIMSLQAFLESPELDHDKWLTILQPKFVDCAAAW